MFDALKYTLQLLILLLCTLPNFCVFYNFLKWKYYQFYHFVSLYLHIFTSASCKFCENWNRVYVGIPWESPCKSTLYVTIPRPTLWDELMTSFSGDIPMWFNYLIPKNRPDIRTHCYQIVKANKRKLTKNMEIRQNPTPCGWCEFAMYLWMQYVIYCVIDASGMYRDTYTKNYHGTDTVQPWKSCFNEEEFEITGIFYLECNCFVFHIFVNVIIVIDQSMK